MHNIRIPCVFRLALATGCALISGCADSTGVSPENDRLWQVRLNHGAANLSTVAPWNTLQLTATLRDVEGTPLTGLPDVIFVSTDPAIEVTSTGLVTVRPSATSGLVIARVTVGNLTRADTVRLVVTDDPNPPRVASLTIDRSTGAVIHRNISEGMVDNGPRRGVVVVVRDSSDRIIPGLSLRFRVSDPTIVTVESDGALYPSRPGQATVFVETTAFGINLRDSIDCIVGDPLSVEVTIKSRVRIQGGGRETYFDPGIITVGVGGIVMWSQGTGDSTSVVFDTPEDADSIPSNSIAVLWYGIPGGERGNISKFAKHDPSNFFERVLRGRRFMRAGTYHYRSAEYGTTGSIVVR